MNIRDQILLAIAINEAMKVVYDQGYVAGGGDVTLEPGTPEMDAYDARRNATIRKVASILAESGIEGLRARADTDEDRAEMRAHAAAAER